MDKEKVCLIIHPKAGKYLAGVIPVLEERWDVTHHVTAYAGHGMLAAQEAQEQGYRWIVALGGDGTLNEVVNGAAKSQGCGTVAVLPGGTANQWAHEIGLPTHPVDAARVLLDSTTRRADIGDVEVQALEFPQATLQQEAVGMPTARDHFLLTAGLGLDAAVIQMTADSFRQRYGQLAFYLTWLETFPRIHRMPVRIRWSSDASWEGQPREILVSNTRRYGSVVDVAPEAYVNDGLLDIRLFWYTEVLFHYMQDRSFSLRIPAHVAMHLDGSSVQLADYLSRENRARLQEATDLERVMVTYRFTVKPVALSVAVPQGYEGDLFHGRRERDVVQIDAQARTSAVVPVAGEPVKGNKANAFRAARVNSDPLEYVAQESGARPFLRMADVILRENNDPKEIVAHLIRMATGGVWSHSALLCSLGSPPWGTTETFLVESRPRRTQFVSWRDEVVPFEQFTVGIKRPRLDWYVETPEEACRHDPADPQDGPGIDYLRHVCGIAVDQINGLYDYKAVFELAVLYLERVAKRYLGANLQAIDGSTREYHMLPHTVRDTTVIADFFKRWQGVPAITGFFKKWQATNFSASCFMRFMCSGLEQYSFFEALRRRIMNDLAIPAHRDAAMSNLGNMQHVIFRDDPEGLITTYIQQVQSGKRAISDPISNEVLNFLKTAVPMDFDTSPNLEWCYVIRKGVVWRIQETSADYIAQSEEEQEVLAMLSAKHTSP